MIALITHQPPSSGTTARGRCPQLPGQTVVWSRPRGSADAFCSSWRSFLIDSPAGRIYFAGDTAYGPHFRHVYEKFGAPNVSLRPIGAYEPRWFMYRMHMNPEEAVRAPLELHSQTSIGIHFGLIDNAGEGYGAHGVEATSFVVPRYGQVFRY